MKIREFSQMCIICNGNLYFLPNKVFIRKTVVREEIYTLLYNWYIIHVIQNASLFKELGDKFSSLLLGSGAFHWLSLLLLSLGFLACLLSAQFSTDAGRSVWVELDHDTQVFQGVLLAEGNLAANLSGSDDLLHFIRVDDTGHISVRHGWARQGKSALELGLGTKGLSKETVKFSKGIFSPDDQSAHVSTRGELEEVKVVDVARVDSWEVSDSLKKRG